MADHYLLYSKAKESVSQDHAKAYSYNDGAFQMGISLQESTAYYERSAPEYEKAVCQSYNGPKIAAEAVRKLYEKSKNVRILDVGAGTGLVGQELVNRGFQNIDALEPCTNMADIAVSKNVYGRVINRYLKYMDTRINNDEYECIVSCGAFGEGHIPCKELAESIRIVKPGGKVVIVMREEYLTYVKEYVGRLENFMEELETLSKWRRLERVIVDDYFAGSKNGIIFVYQVLESGFTPFKSDILNKK